MLPWLLWMAKLYVSGLDWFGDLVACFWSGLMCLCGWIFCLGAFDFVVLCGFRVAGVSLALLVLGGGVLLLDLVGWLVEVFGFEVYGFRCLVVSVGLSFPGVGSWCDFGGVWWACVVCFIDVGLVVVVVAVLWILAIWLWRLICCGVGIIWFVWGFWWFLGFVAYWIVWFGFWVLCAFDGLAAGWYCLV